ncbi:MAG: iron ABC transporter permease [Anaerolineae bacterium]|nr:iron ABC transporter permease [Anaerolineae bacterium]
MSHALFPPLPAAHNTGDKPAPRVNLGLRPGLLVGLALLALLAFVLVLLLGSVTIPPQQILAVLLGGEAEKSSWTNIILKVRLPRALTALLAGAALSVSGLLMQTLFRNPLAAADVLGVNSGASLGVALVVLAYGTTGGALLAGFGLAGDLSLAAAAMLGAGVTLSLILLIARRLESGLPLLLLGVMIGQLTFALVSLLIYFSVPERIQAYINWGFGSFNGVTWAQMPILAGAVLAGLAAALCLGKPLNVLLTGEAYAASMGLHVRRSRQAIIITTALLTGAVTAFCGPIAFIGIAVPHLCRGLLHTSDHRLLLPGTMCLGGAVALLASLLAELPGSSLVLPLNAVMALLGVPVILLIILRQRSVQRSFGA